MFAVEDAATEKITTSMSLIHPQVNDNSWAAA
jgi:hypothetical protein